MSMTREQIIEKLAKRKQAAILNSYGWSDLVSVIQSWTPAGKQKFVDSIIKGSPSGLYQLRRSLVNKAKEDSETYVDNMLADDQLSLSEIEELF